ncbi:hypothetical protein [Kocuria arenosa]|uniref:hypothetical protein n=1 Tax=Kocuria arenosa TaxID=3071446 RepID=UPI0034D3E925
MEWNQDQIGTAIAASVPIVASVVGILTALVSFTKEARLKRRAEMLRAEIGAASLPHDVAILQSLHRATTARIVAHTAVPASRSFGLVVMLLFVMVFPLIAGYFGGAALFFFRAGVLDHGSDEARDWFTSSAVTSAGSLLITYFLKDVILELFKTSLERPRLEALYLSGQDLNRSMSRSLKFPSVESLEPLSDHAKNTAVRIRRRLLVTVWAATLCLGLLPLLYGFTLAGMLSGQQVDIALLNVTSAVALAAGLFFLFLTPGLIVSGRGPEPDEWLHPRPLSPAEQIRTEIETAQRSESPSPRRGLRRRGR